MAPGASSNAFIARAQATVLGYKPASGLPKASFQLVTADNVPSFIQSSVVANVGPTVSAGWAFQAFQFADEGFIAYADNLISELKSTGVYDDYIPNVFSLFKTSKGYVAVPWSMDVRVLWCNTSLLQKAGVGVPTDWDSYIAAGKALKKIGVYAFGTAAGPQTAYAQQALVSLMINNGGGLFDPDGKLDCLYERNVEAMEFVQQMASGGMIDPAAVGYNNQNFYNQFLHGQVAMGFATPSLPAYTGMTNGQLTVTSPLKGPHGDQGTLNYVNNYMMYTNTPSQKGSEAFLEWFLQQFAGPNGLYAKGGTGSLPIRKSIIDLPSTQSDPVLMKMINEWQPVSQSYSYRSSAAFGGLAKVDGGTAMTNFSQVMLTGKTDAKSALTTLQSQLQAVLT